MEFPKISIIIPVLNEEKNIEKCLTSIFNQSYPKNKLEVIVVDDRSTDNTVKIAKAYKTKIIYSGAHHGEISKMIGFKKATGEFAVYLDADIELRGNMWFQKMLLPLIENKNIVGCFTKYYAKKDSPSIERYLCFDPLQRDTIYQIFSPSIETTIIQKNKNYLVVQYSEGKVLPAGLCLYRRKTLLSLVKDYKMFLELDFLMVLVKHGCDKFGYIPSAGLYHHHVEGLGQLINKRKYNLNKVYLARDERLYKWFDLKNPIDQLKIVSWVLWAELFLPSIIVGFIKSIKYRDWAGLNEPFVNFLITNQLIFSFLSNSKGRQLLFSNEH